MIEARGLCKEYRSGRRNLVVLDGVDLEVGAGESAAIMGPSGSGKSTLLHILGTLDTPTGGSLSLGGENPFDLSPEKLADFRNRRVGFVFQDHYLLPQCTALENVLIPALVQAKSSRDDAAKRAAELLERVGLGKRRDYHPGELSGGESQRVAIARALINRPAIVLCDEPTGNLDQDTGSEIAEVFLRIQHEDEVALVLATHDSALAERFDRIVRLVKGRLEAAATP
ncbi:ABC transporter ATP-binding protein [bacterium]|nr:ABC transporter ATP-binding protein [bacterium]